MEIVGDRQPVALALRLVAADLARAGIEQRGLTPLQRHRTPDGAREARIGEEQQLSVVHAAAMVEEVVALRRIECDFGRGEERVVDRFARIGARHLRRIGEEGLRLGAPRTVHILRRWWKR